LAYRAKRGTIAAHMRNLLFIAACAGILVTLCAHPTELLAEPAYRVLITSRPSGAKVWIDDRSGEPAGTTPYDTRLSEGSYTVFLELEGHEFSVQEITVAKRRKGKQRFSFELAELRYGSLDVLAGSDVADGATVRIDGKEVGTVPDTFEVAEGSHQIEVLQDGFEPFENWVEVVKGESLELNVKLQAIAVADTPTQSSVPLKTSPKETKPKSQGPPLLLAAAGMGVGVRQFGYTEPRTNNLRPYEPNSIVLVNVGAELQLGALVAALHEFSLFAGSSLSLGLTSIVANDNQEFATTWLRREVGVRGRLGVGPGWLGVDVAEGGNSFTFDYNGILQDELPETSYEYLRLGVGYGLSTGKNGFGLDASGMLVLATNGVAERFADATVFGMGVHGWYRRSLFSGLSATLAASATQFFYALEAGPLHDADGGYDRMFDLLLNAAYQF
jgi:hypothetical protein